MCSVWHGSACVARGSQGSPGHGCDSQRDFRRLARWLILWNGGGYPSRLHLCCDEKGLVNAGPTTQGWTLSHATAPARAPTLSPPNMPTSPPTMPPTMAPGPVKMLPMPAPTKAPVRKPPLATPPIAISMQLSSGLSRPFSHSQSDIPAGYDKSV
uniref:Uncharacterized protein n=1 Tax=Anopheles atroparvus TaxID=41427 RepID=A0A182JJN8_ANOAO